MKTINTVSLESVTGGWHHFVHPGFGFAAYGAPVAYAPAPVAYAPAPVAYGPAVVGPVAYRFRRF